MNLSEIQDLIKFVSKSGVSEVEIEQKDFKITIKTDTPQKKKAGAKQAEAAIVHQQIPVGVPAMPAAIPPSPPPAPPAPQAKPADATPPKEASEENDKYVTIKSPMIGTFYRAAGPDKDMFVEVGDEIKPGKVICIIEAMKLFNEIEAEISGKIVKVLVDDSSPVEYDQPLFLVDPS